MKLPHSWGDRAPTEHPLSPNKASKTAIELHLIALLAKGVHRNPQTTQAVGKTLGCSPQTDSKSPLLKTTPTQLIEHGELGLASTLIESLPLQDSVFGTGRLHTLHALKREA